MLKKTFLISSVLFGLAFFTIENCLAEISSQHNNTLETQKQLVISFIADGQQQQAETAYQQLLDNFSQNEHLPRAVHHVAYHYRQIQKCEKANQLDQYVIDNWPMDEHAMWAQVDITNQVLTAAMSQRRRPVLIKCLLIFPGITI